MSRVGFALTLVVAAVCTAPHAEALRPCPRHAPVRLVYPEAGARKVPTNAVVFLAVAPDQKPKATLVDAETQQVVATKLRGDGTFLQLVPEQPLEHERRYEVRYRLPYLSDQIAGAFTTGRRDKRYHKPKLSRVKPVFAEPAEGRSVDTVLVQRGGRTAWMEFPKARRRRGADVVELRIRFGTKELLPRWHQAHRYGASVVFAATGGCAREPAAPAHGPFWIDVIPWSGDGRRGEPVSIIGSL